MKHVFFLIPALLILLSGNLFAQDQIIKQSDEVILCKIKEIG